MKRYIRLNSYGYDSELDTGWGNRFQIWKFGYVLNSVNDFEFDLVVEKNCWPEFEYLDMPHVKSYDVDGDFEVIEKDIKVLDKTKNWYFDENIFYQGGGSLVEEYNIPVQDIKLKDRKLDTIIRKKLKNSVGIHIRFKRWRSDNNVELGSICDYQRNPAPLFDYCDSLLGEVNNFYISTDLIRQHLPDFKNSDNTFLSEFYNRYNTIDYSDICEVDNKTMRDVIDLYSLIYCDTFLIGQSTWSAFVLEYRREINKDKNHMIKMEYINANDIR
jgi:hypothetical protein